MKTFKIKHESISDFLTRNLLNMENRLNRCNPNENVVTVLNHNEIFLKKECGLEIGQAVSITVFDRLMLTNRECSTNYSYMVREHDDVSVRLELNDIKAGVLQ